DVVHADGVLDDLDDGLAMVRMEAVTFADGPSVDTPPRVAHAQELGQVGGVERDEVAHLVARGLCDRDALAGAHPPAPRVTGRNDQLPEFRAHRLVLLFVQSRRSVVGIAWPASTGGGALSSAAGAALARSSRRRKARVRSSFGWAKTTSGRPSS